MNVLLCIGLLMFIWFYGNYRHSLNNSITEVIVDVIYYAILIFSFIVLIKQHLHDNI